MANDRQELEDLRRIDELERKKAGQLTAADRMVAGEKTPVTKRLGDPWMQEEPVAPFAWEKGKQGLASIPGLGAMAADITAMPVKAFKKSIGFPMLEAEKEPFPLSSRYEKAAQSTLGYDPKTPIPRDPWGKPRLEAELAGRASEFVGSSMIPGAGVVAKSTTPVKAGLKEILAAILSGEGQVMGERVGEQLSPEHGKDAGGFVGSLTGPIAVQKAIDALYGGGRLAAKGAERAGFTGLSEEARRRAGAEKAAKELYPQLTSPGSIENLKEAETLGKKIPGFRESMTLGRSTGSPYIQSLEKHYGGTVPEALALGQERQTGLQESISKYGEKRFPTQIDTPPTTAVQAKHAAKIDRLDEALTRLDRQERVLASKYARGDAEDVGAEVRNVRGELMNTAKQAAQVRYGAVYDAARKSGLKVEMDDVRGLAQQIKSDEARVFQDDAGVIGKILNRYAPKEAPEKIIETPIGRKIKLGTQRKQPDTAVDFEEFHSLYKEANKEASVLAYAASRGDKEAAQKLPTVQKLRDHLQQKVTAMEGEESGGVGKLLKDANTFYRDKYARLFKSGVGGEMGVYGKFGPGTENAKIIPNLVFKKGDASGVNEYLEMAQGDPKAFRALESGIMDMFSKAVVRDGKVDRKAVESFLREYKEPLDALPGIRSKIDSVDKAADSLAANTKLVIAEQKAFDRTAVAKIAKSDNPDAVVSKAMQSPKTMQALLDAATTPAEKQSLGRAIMEQVTKQSDPLKFMAANEKALKQALGTRQFGFLGTILNAEKVAGRVEAPTHLAHTKLGDPLSEAIGTSIPQAISEQRGVSMRFASPQYAIARVGIRWWNTIRNNTRDQILMDAIFHPEMAESLSSFLKNPTAKTASDANAHLLTYGIRAAAQQYRAVQENRSDQLSAPPQ